MFSRRNMMVSRTALSRDLTLFLLLSTTALTGCGGGGGGGGSPAVSSTPSPKEPSPKEPTPSTDAEKQKENDPAPDGGALPSETGTRTLPVKTVPETPQPSQPPPQSKGSFTISGRVFDGPISGARVYLDVNRDGVIDDGDVPIGVTNADGWFIGTVNDAHARLPIIVRLDGARDMGDPAIEGDEREMTGGTWRGGSAQKSDRPHIISPITELMARTGANSRQIADHFGLRPDIDVTQYDPFAHDADPAIATPLKELGRLIDDAIRRSPDIMQGRPVQDMLQINFVPYAITLSTDSFRIAEGVTSARKLADITVHDDGRGTSGATLRAGSGLFEVRKDGDNWSLWLRGGLSLDFETGSQTRSASIGAMGNGVGETARTRSFTLTITDADDDPTAIRITGITAPLAENDVVSRNTRLATIEVDDPDRNPAFRNWNFTLSPEHAGLLEVREVGGTLGLYFRDDTAPDFEMPAGWTIPIGIAGTTVTSTAAIPVTNRDDPTSGTIEIRHDGDATVGTRLHLHSGLQDQDGDLAYSYRWVDMDAPEPYTLSGRAYFTPQAAGRYKIIVSAKTADFPATAFEAEITITNPVAPTDAIIQQTIQMNENSPRYKPVFDAIGDGTFALTAGYGDNHLFSVTPDGRIWFTGGGPRDMLNYENPIDLDGDNIYAIQMERTFGDNQTQTFDLRLRITDIVHEHQLSTHNASHKPFFTPSVSDQVLAIRLTNFQHPSLILGPTWHMPQEGPLEITWSMVTPWSEEGSATRTVRAFGRREDNFVYTPSQSVIQQRIDYARAAILRALAEFEAATNVRFIEVGEDDHSTGDIRFLFGGHSDGEGRSTGPGIAVRSSMYLKDGSIVALGSRDTGINLFDYWVLVHEIGHTMGLAHPFHSPSGKLFRGLLYSSKSIMSYLNRPHLIDGALTDADIATLQFLYGRPGTSFDGVESRLSTPAPVMELRLSRHEIVLDENTVTTEMKLADFTIVGGSATANYPEFRVGDQSIFELRQEAGVWSLWLRGGQALDHETATGYLALFGEASNSIPLLKPAYFRVKVRDIDEVPTTFTLAASEETRVEAIYPNGHKLTDITVTDDALGSYSLTLVAGTPDIFELRHSAVDGWSLWIRDGAIVDYETLGSELRAVIEMTASGVGTIPTAREFTLTIENKFEPVWDMSLANKMSEWQQGVELQAGTKLADIVLTGRGHVGKIDFGDRFSISGDDRQFFTIVDGELRLARDLTPDVATKSSYSVTIRYNNSFMIVNYESRIVDARTESASSKGGVFQRPPADIFNDGLNDPIQDDDVPPLQMDVV